MEPTPAEHPPRLADGPSARHLRLGEDRPWLLVLAVTTALESAWWAAVWRLGDAPAPFLFTHLAAAFAGLAVAVVGQIAWRRRAPAAGPGAIVGALLVGIAASLFLPLKYAIPAEVPFWLDVPLAAAERGLFTVDPWRLLDHLFGWAAVPIDRLYGLWLPIQTLVLFTVMLQPPSPAKSRALIAYALAWLLLGVAAAVLLSSAGPLFYDQVFGGQAFAPLRDTLRKRGAWVVLAESDRMRQALLSGRPGLVAGISAVPSMHVAISAWMILAARSLAPRAVPCATIFCLFIWLGSVQLGWHYVSDGMAGAAGMLAAWALAGRVQRRLAQA